LLRHALVIVEKRYVNHVLLIYNKDCGITCIHVTHLGELHVCMQWSQGPFRSACSAQTMNHWDLRH